MMCAHDVYMYPCTHFFMYSKKKFFFFFYITVDLSFKATPKNQRKIFIKEETCSFKCKCELNQKFLKKESWGWGGKSLAMGSLMWKREGKGLLEIAVLQQGWSLVRGFTISELVRSLGNMILSHLAPPEKGVLNFQQEKIANT